MTAGNKVTAYRYNKNDELLRTDTLNTDTEKDTAVNYKNDRNGNQLATVNRYEIPEEKKGKTYIDIDVTLGSSCLNKNVVNHYNAENQLVRTLETNGKVKKRYIRGNDLVYADKGDGTEQHYYVTDPHGNVVQLTDGEGKVIKTYEYDSFGNEVKPGRRMTTPSAIAGSIMIRRRGMCT